MPSLPTSRNSRIRISSLNLPLSITRTLMSRTRRIFQTKKIPYPTKIANRTRRPRTKTSLAHRSTRWLLALSKTRIKKITSRLPSRPESKKLKPRKRSKSSKLKIKSKLSRKINQSSLKTILTKFRMISLFRMNKNTSKIWISNKSSLLRRKRRKNPL